MLRNNGRFMCFYLHFFPFKTEPCKTHLPLLIPEGSIWTAPANRGLAWNPLKATSRPATSEGEGGMGQTYRKPLRLGTTSRRLKGDRTLPSAISLSKGGTSSSTMEKSSVPPATSTMSSSLVLLWKLERRKPLLFIAMSLGTCRGGGGQA